MEESNEIRILRYMAWERAKGELRAMISTYCSNINFIEVDEEIERFIELIESKGLQE